MSSTELSVRTATTNGALLASETTMDTMTVSCDHHGWYEGFGSGVQREKSNYSEPDMRASVLARMMANTLSCILAVADSF